MLEDERHPDAGFGFGHNSMDWPGAIAAAVAQIPGKYERRRDEIIEAANRKVIDDRISAGEAADIVKIGGDVWDLVDKDRKAITAPLTEARSAAIAALDKFWQPAWQAIAALEARIEDFRLAERARIAAQQFEQEQAFKAMRPADAPSPPQDLLPAKAAPIRGDLGARVEDREDYWFEITDLAELPADILGHPDVRRAIVGVARRTPWIGAGIPGMTRTTKLKTRIR